MAQLAEIIPYDAYAGKGKRQYYLGIYSSLESDRSSFDSHWQELSKFIAPKRARFTTSERNQGGKAAQAIIDSTARFSLRTLQSGLHAGLTSPARPWFKLSTPNPRLMREPEVKRWLHEVSELMFAVFAQTNLYNALPIVYGDLGAFGTAAMSMLPDSRDIFRCYTYPVGSFVMGLDRRQRATTFMHRRQTTVRQLVEEYGGENGGAWTRGTPINWSRISTTVQTLWKTGSLEKPVELLWVVAPNQDYRPGSPLAKHFEWASCHFELQGDGLDDRKVLRESGFTSFPVMAPRWDVVSDDTYGIDCPGMVALGDVKQLQAQERKKGQAIEKLVDPPLQAPVVFQTQKTSLLPGDITFGDVPQGMKGIEPIHEIGLNLQHLTADTAQVRYRIQRAFYEDLFLMLAQSDQYRGAQPITAREVEERHEEKLLALGPVLERTSDELLNPIIDRAYYLMEERQLIPKPPDALRGINLKVEYISVMAQAQKLVGVVGLDRFMQTAIGMTQAFPEVRAKVKAMRAVDNYADMLGVDPNIIASDDEANAIVEQEAQAVRQQQAAQVAKDTAQAGKLASETNVDQDSALSRLLNGSGAGAA